MMNKKRLVGGFGAVAAALTVFVAMAVHSSAWKASAPGGGLKTSTAGEYCAPAV